MHIDQLAQHLREQTTAFAAAVAGLAPDTRVPTCPDWRVRDLVGHIGQAPRWAAGVIRSGVAAPVPDPKEAEPGPPDEWAGWLREGAAELLDAVHDVGADTPVWTIVGTRPVRWWVRRLLADLVVHHADAAFVAGAPYKVEPELAAETLDEGLALLSTPGVATFQPGDGVIALHAAEGHDWVLDGSPGVADTTVTGTAQDLLLVVTRRLPVERVEVAGDRALFDRWLAYEI